MPTHPTTRTSLTIENKNEQKAIVVGVVRGYAAAISANRAVSDALKMGIGLHIRDTAPTPVPPPSTKPVLRINEPYTPINEPFTGVNESLTGVNESFTRVSESLTDVNESSADMNEPFTRVSEPFTSVNGAFAESRESPTRAHAPA